MYVEVRAETQLSTPAPFKVGLSAAAGQLA